MQIEKRILEASKWPNLKTIIHIICNNFKKNMHGETRPSEQNIGTLKLRVK